MWKTLKGANNNNDNPKNPKRHLPGILTFVTTVIVMMSLNYVLRKCKIVYKLTESREMINQFMWLRYLPRMKKKVETLIQTIIIYSQDIRMEFEIKICALVITKQRKEKERQWNKFKKNGKALRYLEKKKTANTLEN